MIVYYFVICIKGYAFLIELMLRMEELATVENAEVRQQLRHLVLPVTSLALSGHQVLIKAGASWIECGLICLMTMNA